MKEYKAHQLMETPLHDGLETDSEQAMMLLERAHGVLARVLERKLPKELHSDTAHLFKDIDVALSWFSIH